MSATFVSFDETHLWTPVGHTEDRPWPQLVPPEGFLFARPRPARPGPLSSYSSRAEHARAHRLATERNRRNRRRGSIRKPSTLAACMGITDVTVTLELGLQPLTLAFAELGRLLGAAFASAGGVSCDIAHYDDYLTERDETSGPSSLDCSGAGGKWSDLMAQIDELIDDETEQP